MKKSKVIKIMPCAIALSLALTGCSGEKSECSILARHVHRYTKTFKNGISVEKYLDNEHLETGGYNWSEDAIEVTSIDLTFYKILASKDLFNGEDNWDFLYNQMLTHPDYLEYYYYYETLETYTTTDSEGNIEVHTEVVVHDGWTQDPDYWPNTGKVRLNHFRYFGYRVVNKNGKFTLEKSQEVDDYREVIEDYPYVSEKSLKEVSETFKFSKSALRSLTIDDFDTFNHPDLTNKDINLGVARKRNSK